MECAESLLTDIMHVTQLKLKNRIQTYTFNKEFIQFAHFVAK